MSQKGTFFYDMAYCAVESFDARDGIGTFSVFFTQTPVTLGLIGQPPSAASAIYHSDGVWLEGFPWHVRKN